VSSCSFYAVVDDSLSPAFPLGDSLEVFVRREDAERFIEEVRRDDPEVAAWRATRARLPQALEQQTWRGCSRRKSIAQRDEAEMVRRRPSLEAGVRAKLPGLLDIRLVRLDDGTYIDVLRWESREAADAAIEKFADVPEAGEIHEFLAEGLAHYRGEAVA